MLRPSFVLLCTSLCLAAAPPAAPPNERPADFALLLEKPSMVARTALAETRTRQQSLKSELVKRRIPVTGSASTLVNAVFVRIPMARAGELQTIPGVTMAVYLP